MGQQEKRHEEESKLRVTEFQDALNACATNENDLKKLNTRVDTQLKIEDFMVHWRQANHPGFNLYAPTVISVILALIAVAGGILGFWSHTLEERKTKADVVLKAVGKSPEDTQANLEALKNAKLLDLDEDQITHLRSIRPKSQ